MANLNEKTKFICGRNPLAKNNRPSFAHAEQEQAALWLTGGEVNTARSGLADYTTDLTESGDLLDHEAGKRQAGAQRSGGRRRHLRNAGA